VDTPKPSTGRKRKRLEIRREGETDGRRGTTGKEVGKILRALSGGGNTVQVGNGGQRKREKTRETDNRSEQ